MRSGGEFGRGSGLRLLKEVANLSNLHRVKGQGLDLGMPPFGLRTWSFKLRTRNFKLRTRNFKLKPQNFRLKLSSSTFMLLIPNL
jgi:hypothetical protein